MPNITQLIQDELKKVEASEGIKILFACESGSRAWGFPSIDSDYDVRFLYVHQRDWYLSIDSCNKKDQFEKPITDELDIAGWELRKSLNLMIKSNAALLEWLDSPIIYYEDPDFNQLKSLRETYFIPIACMGHYYSMSKNGFETFKNESTCKLKKVFYALRAALSLEWIAQGRGPAPILFDTLLETIVDDKALNTCIQSLREEKTHLNESSVTPSPQAVIEYISSLLDKHEKLIPPSPKPNVSNQALNEILISFLET